MRKLSLILVLLLLAVLTFSACTPETQPTEPSVPTTEATAPPTTVPPTTVPPITAPIEPPVTEPTEPLTPFQQDLKDRHFTQRDKLPIYYYTGESNVIPLDNFGFTLTIPEAWMDAVTIDLYVNEVNDLTSSVTVFVNSKSLIRAYQECGLVEDGVISDFTVALYRTFKSDGYEGADDKFAQLSEEGHALYAGEDEFTSYWIVTMDMHDFDENRQELKDAIGQEKLDEILREISCTPEDALAMFQFTTPAE